MMKTHWLICGSLLALAACDNANKSTTPSEGTKTVETQREANDKAVRAQNEANEKAAKAENEANRDMAKEQAKANETIRGANQDLLKDRNDYEVKTQKSVVDINNKIDQLKVKAQTAKPKAKDDFDMAMRDVDAKKATLDTDMRAMREQPQSFDTLRAKVDREMADWKKSVDTAGSKL